jgi:N-acetylglucosamine kinase-like BadF-type ATPase
MEEMLNYYLDNHCGILLVGDKNSYAVGANNLGQKLTIGGWKSGIMDDGSEYYIGLCAIKAVISEYEMLGGKTLLTSEVKNNLKIQDIGELKHKLYYKKITDKRVLAISKEVHNCAELGDRISISIFNSAAEKLFNMADVMIRRLNMYDSKYKMCITGNIVSFGEYIMKPLCDKIYGRYDNIEIFTYNRNKQKHGQISGICSL